MRNPSSPLLLVDDDPVDLKTVRLALESNNVTNPMVAKQSGPDALAYLEHCVATDERLPCLILLDIKMPGMDGLEVLREIKAREHLLRIPVVMLTTSSLESDRREGYASGAAGYIVKPMEFGAFVRAMQAVNMYWTLCELD